jgi:hypothetical protein
MLQYLLQEAINSHPKCSNIELEQQERPVPATQEQSNPNPFHDFLQQYNIFNQFLNDSNLKARLKAFQFVELLLR